MVASKTLKEQIPNTIKHEWIIINMSKKLITNVNSQYFFYPLS